MTCLNDAVNHVICIAAARTHGTTIGGHAVVSGKPSFYIPAFVRKPILTGRTLARGIYMRTDSIIDIMMKRTTNEDTNPHESNDVSSTKTRKYDLTDMLSRMNQSNRHSEHKTGAAQDKEEW